MATLVTLTDFSDGVSHMTLMVEAISAVRENINTGTLRPVQDVELEGAGVCCLLLRNGISFFVKESYEEVCNLLVS